MIIQETWFKSNENEGVNIEQISYEPEVPWAQIGYINYAS